MAQKDNTKNDIRSLLLRDGSIKPTSYVAHSGVGKMTPQDSMRMAIAARQAELNKIVKISKKVG